MTLRETLTALLARKAAAIAKAEADAAQAADEVRMTAASWLTS
jgi:hypothetical protein